jgi:hypothetical protein
MGPRAWRWGQTCGCRIDLKNIDGNVTFQHTECNIPYDCDSDISNSHLTSLLLASDIHALCVKTHLDHFPQRPSNQFPRLRIGYLCIDMRVPCEMPRVP